MNDDEVVVGRPGHVRAKAVNVLIWESTGVVRLENETRIPSSNEAVKKTTTAE